MTQTIQGLHLEADAEKRAINTYKVKKMSGFLGEIVGAEIHGIDHFVLDFDGIDHQIDLELSTNPEDICDVIGLHYHTESVDVGDGRSEDCATYIDGENERFHEFNPSQLIEYTREVLNYSFWREE